MEQVWDTMLGDEEERAQYWAQSTPRWTEHSGDLIVQHRSGVQILRRHLWELEPNRMLTDELVNHALVLLQV